MQSFSSSFVCVCVHLCMCLLARKNAIINLIRTWFAIWRDGKKTFTKLNWLWEMNKSAWLSSVLLYSKIINLELFSSIESWFSIEKESRSSRETVKSESPWVSLIILSKRLQTYRISKRAFCGNHSTESRSSVSSRKACVGKCWQAFPEPRLSRFHLLHLFASKNGSLSFRNTKRMVFYTITQLLQ